MIKKIKTIVFCIAIVFAVVPRQADAFEFLDKAKKIQEIAEFLNIPADRINIECPQNTLGIEGKGEDRHLQICLAYKDNQKRCEVTISGLDAFPAHYNISFNVREDKRNPSDRWHTIMQLHSFPDATEKWRCPPLSVEVEKGKFRAYSRWDENQISRTYGYNCTEAGSSISARDVISNIPVGYGEWQRFSLDMLATPYKDGLLKLGINQASSKPLKGGNLYNDKRPPYIKLGIYKPAGWSNTEINSGRPICVGYKNVDVLSSKETK